MKTKKPSAIVYGWHRKGTEILISDVYFEEGLQDQVVLYSIPNKNNVEYDFTQFQPDLIISIGEPIQIQHYFLKKIHIHYDEPLADNVLANVIVCQTT